MNHLDVTAGIVWDQTGRILITKRRGGDIHGGEWEFPGGTREPGETLGKCLARELREELGIEVVVGRKIARVEHIYPNVAITLHAFACRLISETPHALECEDWRWVRPNELLNYSLTPPDRRLAVLIGQVRLKPNIERDAPTQQPTP